MSAGRQFLFLLWKGMVLRRRRLIGTVLETLIPLLFIAFFVFLRSKMGDMSPNDKKNYTINEAEDFPLSNYGYKFAFMYYPNSTMAEKLTAEFVNVFGNGSLSYPPKAMESEAAIENEAQSPEYDDDFVKVFGLIYQNLDDDKELPHSLEYKIRCSDPNFNTDKKYPVMKFDGPSNGDNSQSTTHHLSTPLPF